MARYPGKYCQILKITSKNLANGHVQEIPMKQITNGLLVELIRYQRLQKEPTKTLLKWLELLYGRNWPQYPPAELTLLKSLSVLYQKHRRLVIRRNSEKLSEFCLSTYCLPKKSPVQPIVTQKSVFKKTKRRSLFRRQQCQIYQNTTRELAQELDSTQHVTNLLQVRVKTLEEKIGHLSTRNIHKRERRRAGMLARQRKQIVELQEETKGLKAALRKEQQHRERQVKLANDRLCNHKKATLKRLQRYKSRLQRVKAKPAAAALAPETSDDSDFPSDTADRVRELEVTVDELSEALEEMRSERVHTMDAGHYNHKIRECCMKLMSHNVSVRNVDACIRTVLDLVEREAVQLPKKSTVANMMVEARSLAHLQLADELPNQSTNTLHSDGTTKFGEKFGGFQVTTQESSYTLCLAEMKAGGAKDFKEVLQQALSDIEATCCAVEKHHVSKGKEILASLKNTMSDRHVVEKNFNELLEAYRAEVLPDVIEGWNDLTSDQQASLSKVNNFFCGLHFLVALADAAAATLQQWESLHSDENDCSSGSGTIRLIRTACKAVQKHCSQQAGCHVMFRTYLKTQGVTVFPIAKFEGNRFNIVFYNAAGIYYLRHHLIRYLEEVHHTQNKLLQAVLRDLKHPLYLLGCRALGIVRKCITSPLWRILESPLSMSELGQEYQRMHTQFLEWSSDPSNLLKGKGLEQVDDDEVFHELVHSGDDSSLVLELLQMLCRSFSLVSERLLGDHLEEGVHDKAPVEDLDRETATVPKTNARSERDFAILDRMMREKPNCSTLAMESIIMFRHNKTAQWLKLKSEKEKQQLFKACIKLGREQRQVYKQRKQAIQTHRERQILEREQSLIKKKNAEKKKKLQICSQISQDGYWTSGDDAAAILAKKSSETKRKEALKVQLKFRQVVLKQAFPDKLVFQYSKAGKQLTSHELLQNLCILMEASPCPTESEILANLKLLVGTHILHRFEDEDGVLTWYKGLVVGKVPDSEFFEVIYFGEEEVNEFELLEDFHKGDLKFTHNYIGLD